MSGVKKGNYWPSTSVLFAHNLGELIRVMAPLSEDAEAAGKLAEIAFSTISLLRRDGDYELSKTVNLEALKTETLATLRKAANSAIAFTGSNKRGGRIDVGTLLSYPGLSGTYKQVYLYMLLNPEEDLKSPEVVAEASKKLGVTVGSINRVVRSRKFPINEMKKKI